MEHELFATILPEPHGCSAEKLDETTEENIFINGVSFSFSSV
jgi:hypothetical protein